MDSGLGSDDDHKGRTKEQKQLRNQQLLNACSNNSLDSCNNTEHSEQRQRNEERRQGALLFQRSIPQFSMLQINEPIGEINFTDSTQTLHLSETDTPYNSIEQVDTDEAESSRRSLGFYVDLNDISESQTVPTSSTTKNIFSMVIDFEGPKKNKPVKLTSSFTSSRKPKPQLKNKITLANRDTSKLSSSSSSLDVESVASTSKQSVSKGTKSVHKNGNKGSQILISQTSSSSSDSSSNKHSKQIGKESPKCESNQNLSEGSSSEPLGQKNPPSSSSKPDLSSITKQNEIKNGNQGKSMPQFVKLSDLEHQESPIDINFTPCMSRSIPESSFVESPLFMCHSLGYRSAPCPMEPDSDIKTGTEESDRLHDLEPKRIANKLSTDLLRMFLEEIGPDVTIEVESHKFKAHKCILASRCQYFAALLGGNWLEKNGNIIYLQGFSYEAVYFSLCHIYSGTMHVPTSINLVELASLADMLCLEGLKEVVEHALKQRHCHSFHKPCAGCCTGVLEVLPLSAAYGFDDLYQKCLQWITQHFVRVWPNRSFASLPRELRERCYQQHVLHMSPDKVLNTILSCDKILATLPTGRWIESVSRLVVQLADACHLYHRQHYAAVLGCNFFLSLDADLGFGVSQIEDQMLLAAKNLGVEQACRSYSRCCKMLNQSWSRPFGDLLNEIKLQLEQCLVNQVDRLIRCNAWLRLDTALRNRIKELTPNLDSNSRLPRASPKTVKSPPSQKPNKLNLTISSSDSSRNSSPSIDQKGRLLSSAGSTSLRRSLLLAAKVPQVPPSPSVHRKSTLTQPTAASTARSVQSRDTKVSPRYISQRETTKSSVQNLNKQLPPKKSQNDVSRYPSVNRKMASVSITKRIEPPVNISKSDKSIGSPKKTQSRVSSPLPPNRICSPIPKINKSPTHRLNKSPTPTTIKSPTTKTNITSPTTKKSPTSKNTPSIKNSSTTRNISLAKNSQTNSQRSSKANTPTHATEPKPTMQRSSTFLKEEPTILNKVT